MPGATQTITVAAAGTVSVNIPAIVRNQCCDSTSTLTLVATSATVPATVTIDNTAVESETKSKAVETGMHMWCEWEHETKELYAKSAKDLYDTGEVAAAHVICELVRDVDDECEYADRLALKLSAVDYDMQVIVPMQHELHEKYRKKLHDIGKKLS